MILPDFSYFIYTRLDSPRVLKGVQPKKVMERGIGVFTFASRDDRIVPWESAHVPDSTSTINGVQIRRVWAMGRSWNPFDPVNNWGHGEPLWTPEIVDNVGRIAGRNLAAAH